MTAPLDLAVIRADDPDVLQRYQIMVAAAGLAPGERLRVGPTELRRTVYRAVAKVNERAGRKVVRTVTDPDLGVVYVERLP